MEAPSTGPDMSEFVMTFHGDQHDIDADTLAVCLLNMNKVVAAVHKEAGSGEELTLNVDAPSEGSFEVELTLQAADVASAFAGSLGYTDAVLSAYVTILELWRHWSTKEVVDRKDVSDGTTYEFEDGTAFHIEDSVFMVMQRQGETVKDSLRAAFGKMEEDEDIEGYEIGGKQSDHSFKADRDEFRELARGPDEEEEKTEVVEAMVSVYQPSLDGSRQWGVNYDGHKIQASVEDEGFVRRVQSGSIALANGDRLNVDLEIKQEWDQASQDWVNQSYSIISVYDVEPTGRQSDAFIGEDNAPDKR